PPDRLVEHRAGRAWSQLQADHLQPTHIDILKLKKRKSAVYRLHGVGPDGRAVIAKRCLVATAEVERTVYEEFLPRVSVPALRCYGLVKEPDGDRCWLFLEDAGGGGALRGARIALAGDGNNLRGDAAYARPRRLRRQERAHPIQPKRLGSAGIRLGVCRVGSTGARSGAVLSQGGQPRPQRLLL